MSQEKIHTIAQALDALLSVSEARQTPTASAMSDSVIADGWAGQIIHDPVGSSLCCGIEKMGECLNELGGIEAMQDALYLAADMSPENREGRVSRLDRCWSGIGQWIS